MVSFGQQNSVSHDFAEAAEEEADDADAADDDDEEAEIKGAVAVVVALAATATAVGGEVCSDCDETFSNGTGGKYLGIVCK